MTPPIHLTLLALAELAPAARWWRPEEELAVLGSTACDWGSRPLQLVVVADKAQTSRARVSCPECLVMLDWALEQEDS